MNKINIAKGIKVQEDPPMAEGFLNIDIEKYQQFPDENKREFWSHLPSYLTSSKGYTRGDRSGDKEMFSIKHYKKKIAITIATRKSHWIIAAIDFKNNATLDYHLNAGKIEDALNEFKWLYNKHIHKPTK